MDAATREAVRRRAGERCECCRLHQQHSELVHHVEQVVSLFHPRRDLWEEHFVFQGPLISGTSPSGRATVEVLAMNDPRRLEIRKEILKPGALA